MNDDLGPNKERLIEIASQANPGEVLVDLGVREGASSFAMLEGAKDCRVIGVDPAPCPFEIPPRYEYRRTDSVSAARDIPAPLYMVFFDTLHIKQQVMAELYHYWPKIRVGGWAVFHDSEWPQGKHDVYLNITWPQVIDGIRAFFGQSVGTKPYDFHTYFRYEHLPLSWGMTLIQKTGEWNPEVDGMDAALNASQMLTNALCR